MIRRWDEAGYCLLYVTTARRNYGFDKIGFSCDRPLLRAAKDNLTLSSSQKILMFCSHVSVPETAELRLVADAVLRKRFPVASTILHVSSNAFCSMRRTAALRKIAGPASVRILRAYFSAAFSGYRHLYSWKRLRCDTCKTDDLLYIDLSGMPYSAHCLSLQFVLLSRTSIKILRPDC